MSVFQRKGHFEPVVKVDRIVPAFFDSVIAQIFFKLVPIRDVFRLKKNDGFRIDQECHRSSGHEFIVSVVIADDIPDNVNRGLNKPQQLASVCFGVGKELDERYNLSFGKSLEY